MFTFKKLALVGTAGLAALSISCSEDPDDAVSGGTWLPAFDAVYDDGSFELSGKATATVDNSIDTVYANINGVKFGQNEIFGMSVSTNTVDFSSAQIGLPASVCSGKAGQSISAAVAVTVEFATGSALVGSKSVTLTCPAAQSTTVPITSLTVGVTSTNGLFIDLEANKTYNDLDGPNAAQKSKIDLVYTGGFATSTNLGNKLWTALDFGLEQPTFGLQANIKTAIIPLGSVVEPALAAQALATLKTQSSIDQAALTPFLAAFTQEFLEEVADLNVESVDATVEGIYVVKTAEGNFYIVAIKSAASAGSKQLVIAHLNAF